MQADNINEEQPTTENITTESVDVTESTDTSIADTSPVEEQPETAPVSVDPVVIPAAVVDVPDVTTTVTVDPAQPVVVPAVVAVTEPVLNVRVVEVTEQSTESPSAGLVTDDDVSSQQLDAVLKTLRSHRPNPNDITDAQVGFYRVLSRVIVRKPQNEVNLFLEKIMAYIHTHKEIHFGTKDAFRSVDQLTKSNRLNDSQVKEFITLLRVLIDASNPATRQTVIKEINWNSIRISLVPATAVIVFSKLQKFFNIV